MKQLARKLRAKQTDAENLLWRHLRNRNIQRFKFRRQEAIGSFIDFVCFDRKLIVGLDGGQHSEQKAADQVRTADLERRGHGVTRFWNHEVLNDIDVVLERILRELVDPPHPNPLPGGEGARM